MAYPNDPINAVYKIYDGSNWVTYYFQTSASQVGTNGTRQFVTANTKVNGVSFTLNSNGSDATLTLTGANIANGVGTTGNCITANENINASLSALDTGIGGKVPYSGASSNVDIGSHALIADNISIGADTTSLARIFRYSDDLYIATGDGNIVFSPDDGLFYGAVIANNEVATHGWVTEQITALPTPMQFKGTIGSVGSGATISWSELPSASSSEGFTYKVISDHNSAGDNPSCKSGDTIISNGTGWVVVPSGDEPSGTVTSVGLSVPTGLSVSNSPITTNGTLAISLASGYIIPTEASITGKVPYSGATGDVDLGSHSIKASIYYIGATDRFLELVDGDIRLGSGTGNLIFSPDGDTYLGTDSSDNNLVATEGYVKTNSNKVTVNAGSTSPTNPRTYDVWIVTA